MKVYVAGKYEARDRLRAEAEKLKALGNEIVSTWLYGDEPVADGSWASLIGGEAAVVANRDLDEIDACQVLILDTIDESNTGGREVEYGFALGRGKVVTRVGPKRNGFHHLFEGVETWEELLSALVANKTNG